MNGVGASLAVGVGGAIGSMARYWLGVAVAGVTPSLFPWGTLLINVLGSFVIGWFGYLTLIDGVRPASETMRLFVMVGLCGGFTTFSAFSLQAEDMLRTGQWTWSIAYVVASVLLCLAATALGRFVALA